MIPRAVFALALAAFAMASQALPSAEAQVVMGRGALRASISAPLPLTAPVRPASPYACLYPTGPASPALAPQAPLAVWLEGAFSKPAPASAEWAFGSLALRPAVLLIGRGSRLRFVNQDAVDHQPFAISEAHPFNCGRLAPGQAGAFLRFDDHGADGPVFIPVFCALHPWERATLAIMPNAFFASLPPQGGSVEWRAVPAGPCLLKAWRPGLHGGAKRLDLRAGEVLTPALDLRGEDE